MAKVQFSLDGNSMGEFTLNKERMLIGRRPTCDIHIDNLAVSGEHAVIVTIGNDSFLEDLNSTNGTLVNNKAVKKHVLYHGDTIEFGKYLLKYVNDYQAQATGSTSKSGFENTVLVTPKVANVTATAAANSDGAVVADAVTPAPAASAPVTGRLQVLNGASTGRELQLNKALTTLGKAGGQVAVITKRPNGYFITHVEGETMPAVNGKIISAQAHALNDHDVIEMAGLKMEFYLA